MSLLGLAGGVLSVLSRGKDAIAARAGVDEGTVSAVLKGVDAYLSKDERARAQLNDFVKDARAHDISTFVKDDVFSNRLRSVVRPLVTFAAMGWYLYARSHGIPLAQEDYAIIGGVLAFWFGFRPFEKRP
ncbi:MAG: hypothetical protein OSB62_02820 [Alphaproteobacteria bacterium]|nr:hypothetical protein [Alphaproteobacteria bacterium]